MSCNSYSFAPKPDHRPIEHDITDNCVTTIGTPCQPNRCIQLQSGCPDTDCCTPIPEVALCSREYRLCTDADGCAARYPADCRNRFWPAFSHPRWLPCRCLYCAGKGKQ